MHSMPTEAGRVAGLIRHEHGLLKEKIGQLRTVCACARTGGDCAACGAESTLACEREVARILEEVFVFMVEHFRTEEAVMREHRLDFADPIACESHREAHAEITERARHLITGLTPQTVLPRLDELVGLIEGWIGGHIAAHDHALLSLLGVERRAIPELLRAEAR